MMRRFAIGFATLILSGLSLHAEPAPRYNEAVRLYQQGKFEDCLAVIRSVFDTNRNSAELRALAGAAYLAQGQTDPALAHAKYCVTANPQSIPCRLLRVRALRRAGQPGEAARAAESALRDLGENSNLRMEAAASFYASARFDLARRHLEKVIAADQKHFAALYLDGLIFLRQGRYEAEFRLRNALNAPPRSRSEAVRTLVNLGAAIENQARQLNANGQAAQAAARNRQAMEFYARALELNPEHAAAKAARQRLSDAS